jgi:predicted kinase
MAKPVWNTTAGSLGTLQEKTTQSINLSATDADTFSVISGKLPGGLRLEGTKIVGTPFEVPDTRNYEFVLRASNSEGSIDRTFTLTVEGEDPPFWITPQGSLPVGPQGEYFILNRSPLDYQLTAGDNDLSAGETIEYYLDDLFGDLPPGLSLAKDGRLTGVIDAELTLDYKNASTNYDRQQYDVFPYDYGGGDDGSGAPRFISRFYEFFVYATDGITRQRRTFRILVVNEQQFRADTLSISADTDTFISSATYLRAPIWTTTGNLGIKRANNFVTIPLEVYDPNQYSGTLEYSLVTNADSTASVLPQGMQLDTNNGVLFGKVPYQPAVTQSFTFTVQVKRTDPNTAETVYNRRQFIVQIQGEVDSTIRFTSPVLLGTLSPNQTSTLQVQAETILTNADVRYNLVSGTLPPGITLGGSGELIGKVNQFETSPGAGDGLLTIDLSTYGLNSFSLDGGTTSIDRIFRFTIQARDYYQTSAVEKEFRVAVRADTLTQYSNIYLQPLLPKEKRQYYYNFTTDNTIFPQTYLYRPNDQAFGTQNEIRMLLQHGIETLRIEQYVPFLVKNFNRKTFKFGEVKIATATNSNNEHIYEVIYVELLDEFEKGRVSISDQLDITNANNLITVDAKKYKASTNVITIDQLVEKFIYPNSVSNMQKRLREIIPSGDSTLININEEFLPLWMSSTQETTGTALGYTKAVPICYTKPGFGAEILENIKDSGFDFKNIEFEVDRLTIDSVEGETGDKYIAFPKRKVI